MPVLSKLCLVKYCKKEVDGTKQRCNDCNSLRMRLSRALAASPTEVKEKFDAQSSVDKETFMQDCTALYGDALVKMITTTFTVSRTVENEVKLQGTGDFMDSPDLRERYKAKPKRLEAILKNAKKFEDTQSETMLYEDMTYKSTYTGTDKQKREESRVCETEQRVKQKCLKRAKTESGEPKQELDGEVEKTLTEAQLAGLRKKKNALAVAAEKLQPIVDALKQKEFAPYMPPAMAQSLATTVAAHAALEGEIDLVLESKSSAWKSLNTKLVQTKISMDEAIKTGKMQKAYAEKEIKKQR